MEPICSDRSDVPICHSTPNKGIDSRICQTTKQARIDADAQTRHGDRSGPVPVPAPAHATQANFPPSPSRPAASKRRTRTSVHSRPAFLCHQVRAFVGGRGGGILPLVASAVRPPAYIYGQATAPQGDPNTNQPAARLLNPDRTHLLRRRPKGRAHQLAPTPTHSRREITKRLANEQVLVKTYLCLAPAGHQSPEDSGASLSLRAYIFFNSVASV